MPLLVCTESCCHRTLYCMSTSSACNTGDTENVVQKFVASTGLPRASDYAGVKKFAQKRAEMLKQVRHAYLRQLSRQAVVSMTQDFHAHGLQGCQ
jgi:hypothetical protein